MKAKLLKEFPPNENGAVQKHYECDDGGPLPKHVIVSAVVAKGTAFDIFDDKYGPGAETFIFAADEKGNVTRWVELRGSFKGELDHDKALRNAGYEPS